MSSSPAASNSPSDSNQPLYLFDYDKKSDCVIVALLPALNSAPVSDVEESGNAIESRIRDLQPRRVLLDLTPLDYLNSPALTIGVRVWKWVTEEEEHRKLVTAAYHEFVIELLRTTALLDHFNVVSTRDEAMGVLKMGQPGLGRGAFLTLSLLSLLFLATGLAGLALVLYPREEVPYEAAWGATVGGGAIALLMGAVLGMRGRGAQRGIGILLAVAGLGTVVAGVLAAMDIIKPI